MGLRELRRRKGLTQSALSERTGIAQTRISEFEVGTRDVRDMRVRTALKLMDALGTRDVRDLFDEPPAGD